MIGFSVMLIAVGAQMGSGGRHSYSTRATCDFDCGVLTVEKDGKTFTIGSGKDITYKPSATTCLTKCSVVAGGMLGSSCADVGGEKVAKEGSNKLCCMSMTCPTTTTTTTTTAEPTLEEKFECKPGQGEAWTTYQETGDNSFESCAALCDDECEGFDFTEAESTKVQLWSLPITFQKADSCRLYKANKPRFNEKSHRMYCSKKWSEEEETPVEEAAQEAMGEAAEVSRPDFNGHWKMTRCEGDFDSFLKEMGMNWAVRKAAKAAGYGAGSTYLTIKQNDDDFSLTTTNPKGVVQTNFVTDGTEQDEKDPADGSVRRITPRWDGDVLHIDARKMKPAMAMPVTRRYFSGKDMVMEQTSPQGIVIKRFFELQEKP